MKAKFLFSLSILFCGGLHAQDDTKQQFIHRGIIRAMATISSGSMFQQKATNIYAHADLEYYIADNVSLRGDGFYFVSTMGDYQPFKMNHSLFSGASYHFKTKSHLDPYLGFAPGISFTQIQYYPTIFCDPIACSPIIEPDAKVDPLASAVLGFNLYFQKIFHLFIESRYVYGRHFSNAAPQSLSELRFSFGLGWNLSLIKKDKA
jgi:hypothetical protein